MQLDIILHGIFYGSNIRNNIRNIFDNYSKHFFFVNAYLQQR